MGRKVGLKHRVHLAAFGFDWSVRAINPDRLWNTSVSSAMRECVDQLAVPAEAADDGDDAAGREREARRKVLQRSLSSSLNEFMGEEGVYKDVIKSAVQLAKDAATAADRELLKVDPDAKDDRIKRLICKLNAVGGGLAFWKVVRNERLDSWTGEDKAKHDLFCFRMIDLQSIVVHSCATERHGKGYKLFHTAFRTSIGETRLKRLLYVFSNYGLLYKLLPTSLLPSDYVPVSAENFIFSSLEDEEADELRVCERLRACAVCGCVCLVFMRVFVVLVVFCLCV